MHDLLPGGVDLQQYLTAYAQQYEPSAVRVLTAYAHLKNVVLRTPQERGGTTDAEGGSHDAAARMNAAEDAPVLSRDPGGNNDAEGVQEAQHARLRKLFVKTYEEKISWLNLFGTYHHV